VQANGYFFCVVGLTRLKDVWFLILVGTTVFARVVAGPAADLWRRIEADSMLECSDAALLHVQSTNCSDCLLQVLAGCSSLLLYKGERLSMVSNGNPFQSYWASPAIWDHTVLPATRHRWTHPALTPAMHASTWFTYHGGMEGWVDLGDWL